MYCFCVSYIYLDKNLGENTHNVMIYMKTSCDSREQESLSLKLLFRMTKAISLFNLGLCFNAQAYAMARRKWLDGVLDYLASSKQTLHIMYHVFQISLTFSSD